jgi:hypothetical protein
MMRNEPEPALSTTDAVTAKDGLSGHLPAGLLEVRFNDTKSFHARVLALPIVVHISTYSYKADDVQVLEEESRGQRS